MGLMLFVFAIVHVMSKKSFSIGPFLDDCVQVLMKFSAIPIFSVDNAVVANAREDLLLPTKQSNCLAEVASEGKS